MMHDLPTPAPSSDPPMPGSSPVKPSRADKAMLTAKAAAVSMRPFSPLDLNTIGNRVKAFQDAREKAGATPPPSSPPPSSVFHSSPVAPAHHQQLGFSPVKQQRAFPASVTPARSIVLAQSEISLSRAVTPSSKHNDSISHILGLVPNQQREKDANAIPTLLYGSKSVSLVIGRSKPSGEPHRLGEQGSTQADIPASMHGLGSKNIMRVNLPNDARHVSRVHAIVEWIPFVARPVKKPSVSSFTAKGSPIAARLASQNSNDTKTPNGTFIVRIVGQNGLIVDGKRRREGQVLRLTSGKTLIDFFGVKCRFECVPSSVDRHVSPVKSTQARILEWTQRNTSPVKKGGVATSSSVPTSELSEPFPSSSPPASSPPPMLGLRSPSKTQAAPQGTQLQDDEEEDPITNTPTPVNRRSGGLVAGPLNAQQVRAGDSGQEDLGNGRSLMDEDDDDEDDESDDEDDVPAEFEPTWNALTVTRKPVTAVADDDDSSSLSDLDSGLIDQQIGDSTVAAQPESMPAPAPRKRTVTAGSNCHSRESSAKPVAADVLTASQTKMPPPAATIANVRSSARRSASNSPAPSSPLLGSSVQELQALARTCVRQLASTYDLPGLLAGAIVFHRTATISASEAVRSVLTTTPDLMRGEAGEHSVAFSPSKRKLPGAATLQHGCVVEGWPTSSESSERWTSIARKAWREHLEVVLQSSPMFGVIQRAGKDASGNPLECWYYYDKENDPDKERAENLGVFAKPMRKALKGQKPIFWKRSGYASRQTDDTFETKPSVQDSSESVSASSSRKMEAESMDIASAPLPSSSIGSSRKRKAHASQSQAETQGDNEERKREKLRAKIAKSGLWDETQPEEKEAPTWDRKGDQDYKKGRK